MKPKNDYKKNDEKQRRRKALNKRVVVEILQALT